MGIDATAIERAEKARLTNEGKDTNDRGLVAAAMRERVKQLQENGDEDGAKQLSEHIEQYESAEQPEPVIPPQPTPPPTTTEQAEAAMAEQNAEQGFEDTSGEQKSREDKSGGQSKSKSERSVQQPPSPPKD